MDGDIPKKRQRANRLIFPAAEPDYRAARQRCAESCARYNARAEFSSPEARARLWQDIVAPQAKDSSPDLAANESQIDILATGHKIKGKGDPGELLTDDEATREAPLVNGPAAAEPDVSHSSGAAQALKRLQAVSTSPEARPAVTPPPSPEYKGNISKKGIVVNGDSTADDCPVADTPPPSRKSSLLKLSRPEATHAAGDQQEHDPAVTNPFIVNAPYCKPPVYIDYGTNLHIGNGTFINRNFVVIDSPVCPIRIGERCLFGPNVILAAVEHPLDADERISPIGAPSIASSIEIGDECWIATGVKILCGVKIGSGCVIGAGSVVTKDIPDGCIAYGNPARVARVCSPRFQKTGKRPTARPEIFESPVTAPRELIRKYDSQQSQQDSQCRNGCTFRCSTMVQNHSVMQRGKDAVLLLIGLASLVHFIRTW